MPPNIQQGKLAGGSFRFSMTIEGLDELKLKLVDKPVYKEPMLRALEKSAIVVESEAKRLTPVDTGRLRASISHRMGGQSTNPFAEVGTNIKYGIYVHEGRRAGAKMPPPGALSKWAGSHGFGKNVFVLARAISRKGIKPRRFLTDALVKSKDKILGYISRAASEIEGLWGK